MAQLENDANGDSTLALFIGESFAEAVITSKGSAKPKFFHRWYLGKEGLRGGLQRFLQANGVEKVQSAYVGSRFLEKIFSYRLGGSVATVTTSGFEGWPTLRQPSHPKPNNLSSAELIFSVDERCNSEGVIEKELEDAAMAFLAETLRAKQAKRVCIHFLNSHLNPHNQNRLQKVLADQGFEVYVPSVLSESKDEVGRWRRNILNASVSGTFEEVQSDLNLALAPFLPEGQHAQFVASQGQTFSTSSEHRLSSLWGASFAWTEGLRKLVSEKFDVLYLGLEQFALFYPGKTSPVWQSPWGKIEMPHVRSHSLALQPTSAIDVNSWGTLDFSTTVLGYEPGPMFMGRGQVPTLLDLWAGDLDNILALSDRRSAPGMQKFKNQIWALNKTSSEALQSEDKVQPALRERALEKLVMDIQLNTTHKKILCVGTLAPLFFNLLNKRLSHHQLELRPEFETASLLLHGVQSAH